MQPFGEPNVPRQTGALRGGSGRCGSVQERGLQEPWFGHPSRFLQPQGSESKNALRLPIFDLNGDQSPMHLSSLQMGCGRVTGEPEVNPKRSATTQ